MIWRAVVAALLSALPATAQEALYGVQPPAGSAYVRFANATAAPVQLSSPALPDQALGTADAARVTPYVVVEQVATHTLPVTLHSAGHTVSAELSLRPDAFATVLLRPAADGGVTATVVSDGAEFNQARARVSFYNATASCEGATLALVPAGTAVFTAVAPGAGRSRSVNPVTAQIRATCGGGAAPDLQLTGMEVGGSYSIWLMQAAATQAFVSRDTTAAYKR